MEIDKAFVALRGALSTLTPKDMELIFNEAQQLNNELHGQECPEDWFYNQVLHRFKAKKYSQIPIRNLISNCLRVTKYGAVSIQLVPNSRQNSILTLIDGDAKLCQQPKYRREGVTTILTAFCAVKAYLAKTRIIFFSPNGASKKHVTEAILEFLQQLDAALELTTESGVFDARSVANGYIKLYNGSEIKFYTGDNQVEPLRGLGEVDYVIFDESDLIKNINDLNASARIIISENGKILNTYTIDKHLSDDTVPQEKKYRGHVF